MLVMAAFLAISAAVGMMRVAGQEGDEEPAICGEEGWTVKATCYLFELSFVTLRVSLQISYIGVSPGLHGFEAT